MKSKSALLYNLFSTLLMTLPLIVGIAFLVSMIYGMWQEYQRYSRGLTAKGSQVVYSQLAVLTTGEPVISQRIRHENHYQDKLTTLDGSVVPPGSLTLYPVTLQPDSDQVLQQFQFQARMFAPLGVPRQRISYQLNDSKDNRLVWRFRESQRHPGAYSLIRTDGFLQQTIEDYLDRNGSRKDEPGPESSFGQPSRVAVSSGVIVFQSRNELLAVDLKNKSVAKLGDPTALRWGFRNQNSNPESRPEIILVSDDSIRTVDYSGMQLQSYAVDGRVTDFYDTDKKRLFVRTTEIDESESDVEEQLLGHKERLYELGDDGQAREVAQLDHSAEDYSTPEATSAFVRSVEMFIKQTGLGIIFPGPAALLGFQSVRAYNVSQYQDPDGGFMTSWQKIKKESPWAFPMSAFFGAIAAYFCYSRQRRYQARWTKTWTVFVFLFGPAGYLAWRWHREWPPPALVGVTREEFEGPVANGLEVFA